MAKSSRPARALRTRGGGCGPSRPSGESASEAGPSSDNGADAAADTDGTDGTDSDAFSDDDQSMAALAARGDREEKAASKREAMAVMEKAIAAKAAKECQSAVDGLQELNSKVCDEYEEEVALREAQAQALAAKKSLANTLDPSLTDGGGSAGGAVSSAGASNPLVVYEDDGEGSKVAVPLDAEAVDGATRALTLLYRVNTAVNMWSNQANSSRNDRDRTSAPLAMKTCKTMLLEEVMHLLPRSSCCLIVCCLSDDDNSGGGGGGSGGGRGDDKMIDLDKALRQVPRVKG